MSQLQHIVRPPNLAAQIATHAKPHDSALDEAKVTAALTKFEQIREQFFPPNKAAHATAGRAHYRRQRRNGSASKREWAGALGVRVISSPHRGRRMSRTKIKIGVAESLVDSAGGITVSVPLQFKRRSGRRLVMFPNAQNNCGARRWDKAATPLQLALAKGFVWLRALEAREVSTLRELTKREGVDNSYVTQ